MRRRRGDQWEADNGQGEDREQVGSVVRVELAGTGDIASGRLTTRRG
jgi:hypothetical protein